MERKVLVCVKVKAQFQTYLKKSFALWEGESKISNVPEEKFKAIDIDTASLEAFDGGVLCAEVNVHHIVI